MKHVYINHYPKLTIDNSKLLHNIRRVVADCGSAGIQVAGVIKGFNGIPEICGQFVKGGCAQIATSRMDQIVLAKAAGIESTYMLIRIPMLSEVENVVTYCDISLNSELTVIEAIHRQCLLQEKNHGVVLMADLGDLREGIWEPEEFVRTAVYIEEKLPRIKLLGVGTNLGCYGSIKPTVEKMQELIQLAEEVEAAIGRRLEILSGGATSSYPLVLNGQMPDRINHLRIGEGMILAYDLQDLWGLDMTDLHQDVFTFQAEIVEIKDKPTHPVGEIFIDGFGYKPAYEDRGIRKRAILATGKLDYAINDKILPRLEGIEVIGSSSDHTILDIEDCPKTLKIGDILEFDVTYPSLMYLTENPYINIQIIS